MAFDQQDGLDAVFAHFYKPATHEGGEQAWKLNRELQYLLCTAFQRLKDTLYSPGSFEMVMLAESWVMAQGTKPGHKKPLVRVDEPEEL